MLKQLKTYHREIARLSFQGFNTAEIANRLDTGSQAVGRILRDPLCKSFLAGLMDKADDQVINVRKKLLDLNPKALGAFDDILDKDSSAPASVILNAAKDILDRNGYKAPEQHQHLAVHLTTEDIKKMSQRANSVNTDYLPN